MFPDSCVRLWYVPTRPTTESGAPMEIFSQAGLGGALLIAHVVVAIMWMGLLWFFNFVQTPAYAEMDGAARNNAFDKITWRALWWFRWAAAATVGLGLLIIALGGS